MPDPFLDALAEIRGQAPAPAAPAGGTATRDPYLDALAEVRGQAADHRSKFAKAVDYLSEPSAPGRKLQSAIEEGGRYLTEPVAGESPAWAMTKGAVAGGLQGLGDVRAGFTSPLGAAAGISGIGAELGAGGRAALPLVRALRATEAATGAAFGERGLEQMAEAPDWEGRILGGIQAATGAAGLRAGVQGLRYPRGPIRGLLPAATGFVGDEFGNVARAGTEIPKGATAAADADRSFVKTYDLKPIEYAYEETTGPKGGKGQVLRPSVYSLDPNAEPAPKVSLSVDETRELRRMIAEMDEQPFNRKRGIDTGELRRGGDLTQVAGNANAPVYRDIVGPEGREFVKYGAPEVRQAMVDYLNGERSPL